jgi:hypothetical protein
MHKRVPNKFCSAFVFSIPAIINKIKKEPEPIPANRKPAGVALSVNLCSSLATSQAM